MRNSKPFNIFVVGTIVLVAATFLYIYADQKYFGINFYPVCDSVSIIDGFTIERDFTVEREADYDIGIKCKNVIPFELIDDMLMRKLRLGYQIYENGNILTQEDSLSESYTAGYARDDITRTLATFHAIPGKHYRIKLDIKGSLPELVATQPQLIVEINFVYWKKHLASRGMLYTLLITILGVVGVAYMLLACIVQIKHNATRSTHTELRAAAGAGESAPTER